MRRQTLPSHPSHICNNMKVKVGLLQSGAMPHFPCIYPWCLQSQPQPLAHLVPAQSCQARCQQEHIRLFLSADSASKRVSPIPSLFQLHRGANWSSVTTKSSCIKSRHLFIFLITLLLPFFSPLQNLKAGLLSQFDYKISTAIQANLPWESSQTLLVYNRYDEREKRNTNALVVAMI